jgi:hypothetical protein
MNSLELSGISASWGSDMDCGLFSYIFLTMVLSLVTNLAFLLPYTALPYLCFGLLGMLSSSNPPTDLRGMDPSADIGFLPFVEFPAEPLPVSETSVVTMGILSVVAVN